MNQIELQVLVEKTSLDCFGLPFQHQATFNNRLRTTGGRYHLKSHHLDFNLKVLETFGADEFLGVIKHELCHYHLHLSGKGFQHKDKEFKQLLTEVGGSRFVKSLGNPKPVKKRVVYQCQSCAQFIYRQRKVNTQKYVCGQCSGKLLYIKIQE
ncbi:hypothetical protein CAT7_06478 [Carnobacterium sp. AT7]|uniref:SprT family protein n=1 Tax=Carnobacterium TaxID=2747 RepID=UPI00015F2AEC|nr:MULTISPECIES: SprT family protein [Carnobacterium]EDP68865.1 hypothetical protein CAT7_06478 [Carnobacterium sp. AT7]